MLNIKKDFPLLQLTINDRQIVYVDNAATTQKPQAVLDAMMQFYTHSNANVHRGVHFLAEHATQLYEDARAQVAQFINAQPEEIVFTRGTTESINLVAATWAAQHIKAGDEIVLTELEHHSNLLPWQALAQKSGAVLKFIPVNEQAIVDSKAALELISHKTKLVSMVHVSNTIGVHVPIKEIIDHAQMHGARVLIDAAQSIVHQPIDVKKMNCDFLAFSAHKMLGPTGIGVLYIKKELHEDFPPYQLGGGMVMAADYKHATLLPLPHRLEAGTPAIAQAIGLSAAIDYIQKNISWATLRAHEAELCKQLIDGLQKIPRIIILGPLDELQKVGHMVSFVVAGIHAHDVAAYLSAHGICARAGHHCAQPLAKKLGIDASVRISFYGYNTSQEVDYVIDRIQKLVQSFLI